MEDQELDALLNQVEQQDVAIDAIYDANTTGDEELTAQRIATALQSLSNTDKMLVRAINGMNQQTRLISEDIKEERLLISSTHDELQKVLNVNGSLQNAITSTIDDYKWQLKKVVNKQDDELQETTERAVHHINKSVAVGGFLIILFSCLGALLGLIGLFFTVHFGDFFKELWLTNPFMAIFIGCVEFLLFGVCAVKFQKSVVAWWDKYPKDDKKK